MTLTISTNTASISAQRHLQHSRADLNTAMERLSSGKRINSAGDDSAGLAIRDKMTSQIEGLNQAVRNANDAVSLLQAAEGGMEEVTTILQRMRTLAVQASNDTNTRSDRQNLADEISDLSAEINRISETSTFNNQNLLNGSFDGTFQVGAKSGETIDLTIKDVSTNKIGTAGDGLVAYKSGSEFKVNTTTIGSQATPNVTGLKDGGYVVTWHTETTSNGRDVYAQRYGSDGSAIGNEFTVNTYTSSGQWDAKVTDLEDGGYVITWYSWQQDGNADSTVESYGIYAQRFDKNGVKIGDEIAVNSANTSDQKDPHITSLADGGFVIVWESDGEDGADLGIYGRKFDATGNAAGTEFKVNSYTTSTQGEPSITSLSDGGFIVSWESWDQISSTSDYDIYAQRYDQNATTVGDEFLINTFNVSYQAAPSIAGLENGGFVATWKSWDQISSTSDYDIYAQRYDNHGNSIGTEFLVNTHSTDNQTVPEIAALKGGGFIITWASGDYNDTVSGTQDGSDYGIFGQQYDSKGNTIGDEFQINSTATGDQDLPHIAALESGGFMAVWESDGTDGDSWGIYGQRYISNGIADMSLLTREKASYAITVIDSAIDQIGRERSKLGALQNRLDHAVSNMMNMSANTEDARSIISDADYAVESSDLAKSQIIQQAGTAMLAQANSSKQLVLSLLK